MKERERIERERERELPTERVIMFFYPLLVLYHQPVSIFCIDSAEKVEAQRVLSQTTGAESRFDSRDKQPQSDSIGNRLLTYTVPSPRLANEQTT